jgi:hypothetical protein
MIDIEKDLETINTPINTTQDTQDNTEPMKTPVDDEVERRAQNIAQERNFKMLREQNEEYARKMREYENKLRELEMNKQQVYVPEQNLSDDDFVDYKIVKREKQEREAQLAALQSQMAELAIKAECPDFYQVVTKESVERLAKENPELAYVIDKTQDFKAKALSTYTLIKKLGYHQDDSEDIASRIHDNTKKPKNASTIKNTDNALNDAHLFERGLSEKEKEARCRLMQHYMRGNK